MIDEKTVDLIKKETSIECYNVETKIGESDVYTSKFGGSGFCPHGFEYPHDLVTNKPLCLLAQINFEDIIPLDGFPSDGLLQFYVACDANYGCDFSNTINRDGFSVIYHNKCDYIDNHKGEIPIILNEDLSPVKKKSSMKFSKQDDIINVSDYRFEAVCEAYGVDESELAETEQFYDCGSKISGYPIFIQDDPRLFDDSIKDYDTLLLGIQSVETEIEFGFDGYASFMINKEDLKRLDFSRVSYSWDC